MYTQMSFNSELCLKCIIRGWVFSTSSHSGPNGHYEQHQVSVQIGLKAFLRLNYGRQGLIIHQEDYLNISQALQQWLCRSLKRSSRMTSEGSNLFDGTVKDVCCVYFPILTQLSRMLPNVTWPGECWLLIPTDGQIGITQISWGEADQQCVR